MRNNRLLSIIAKSNSVLHFWKISKLSFKKLPHNYRFEPNFPTWKNQEDICDTYNSKCIIWLIIRVWLLIIQKRYIYKKMKNSIHLHITLIIKTVSVILFRSKWVHVCIRKFCKFQQEKIFFENYLTEDIFPPENQENITTLSGGFN